MARLRLGRLGTRLMVLHGFVSTYLGFINLQISDAACRRIRLFPSRRDLIFLDFLNETMALRYRQREMKADDGS